MSKFLLKLREKSEQFTQKKMSRNNSRKSSRRGSLQADLPEVRFSYHFTRLLASFDDQRDFREFLDVVGLPDLNSYVDFVIQVHALKNSGQEHRREMALIIYHRHIRSYANEKVLLDWPTKTRIESQIQAEVYDDHLFDHALTMCIEKLEKLVVHFYEKSRAWNWHHEAKLSTTPDLLPSAHTQFVKHSVKIKEYGSFRNFLIDIRCYRLG